MSPDTKTPPRYVLSGGLFALVSATSFGLISTLARLYYDAGGNMLTLVAIRPVLAALCVGVLAPWLGFRLTVPRPALVPVAGISAGLLIISISYLSAILFIPVGLAALLLYTYPLMVAGAVAVLNKKRPSLRTAGAFVLAFAGLALAIGPGIDSLDVRGILLALTAAGGAALVFVLTPLSLRHMDIPALTFQTNLWAGALIVPVVFISGRAALPETSLGWTGFLAATLFYTLAVLAQYAAIRYSGPAKAALLFNVEPLVSIAAAAAILGERLSAVQLLGGGLVIGALVISGWKPLKAFSRDI